MAEGIFFGVDNFLENDLFMAGIGLSKGCKGKTYIIKVRSCLGCYDCIIIFYNIKLGSWKIRRSSCRTFFEKWSKMYWFM